MGDIILHLGLAKTGSSFLQKEIFPKLNNCEVYGVFNKPFHIETKLIGDKISVISNEQYSGRPNTILESADRNDIAKRFHAIFPDAKVIVVFRDKKEWINSLYLEYLKSGRGIYTYNKWYDEIFDKSSLDFESYKSFLKNLFDEVLFCQFSDLKSNPDYFVKTICDFIGVDVPEYENEKVNVRFDKKTIERWRKFNRFFYSRYSPHKGIFPEYMNPLMHFLRLMQQRKRMNGLIKKKWL